MSQPQTSEASMWLALGITPPPADPTQKEPN